MDQEDIALIAQKVRAVGGSEYRMKALLDLVPESLRPLYMDEYNRQKDIAELFQYIHRTEEGRNLWLGPIKRANKPVLTVVPKPSDDGAIPLVA